MVATASIEHFYWLALHATNASALQITILLLLLLLCYSVVGGLSGDKHGGTRQAAGSTASTETSVSPADSDSVLPAVSVIIHRVLVTTDWFSLFHLIHRVHGVQWRRRLSFHLLSLV